MQTNFEPARVSAQATGLCASEAILTLTENKTRIETEEAAQKKTGEPLIYSPHYLHGGANHSGLGSGSIKRESQFIVVAMQE